MPCAASASAAAAASKSIPAGAISCAETTGRSGRRRQSRPMPKRVQLSAYGGIDQLKIVEVPKPEPQAGEGVVRVVGAGTNPGEISIREGYLKDMFPMGFRFGEG